MDPEGKTKLHKRRYWSAYCSTDYEVETEGTVKSYKRSTPMCFVFNKLAIRSANERCSEIT